MGKAAAQLSGCRYIARGNALVERIKPLAQGTVRTGVGGFGALFPWRGSAIETPILVSSTDGVGTKQKLAVALDGHDTIGIDLVAMCVNDVVVRSAEPLFFLDYFATVRFDVEVATRVSRSQPLPALWPRTAAPDQSPPDSPSGHRPTALPMGGLNRTGRRPAFMRYRMSPCASPPRRRLLKPPHTALRLCPPLTLPRPRTILPDQPNCRTHKGKLNHDRRAEPTGTASRPRPAPYNPQGS